jgi:Fe-S cluster assembly ATP-binding protein
LLDELQPDFVHIMIDGRIVKSGGMEIAEELEKSGYESYKD